MPENTLETDNDSPYPSLALEQDWLESSKKLPTTFGELVMDLNEGDTRVGIYQLKAIAPPQHTAIDNLTIPGKMGLYVWLDQNGRWKSIVSSYGNASSWNKHFTSRKPDENGELFSILEAALPCHLLPNAKNDTITTCVLQKRRFANQSHAELILVLSRISIEQDGEKKNIIDVFGFSGRVAFFRNPEKLGIQGVLTLDILYARDYNQSQTMSLNYSDITCTPKQVGHLANILNQKGIIVTTSNGVPIDTDGQILSLPHYFQILKKNTT